MWFLCLAGLFLPQTYGVLTEAAVVLADIAVQNPIGLVEKDYLYGDNSDIQNAEDLDVEVDGLQKRVQFSTCGNVPVIKYGICKVHSRKAIVTCQKGYELLGNNVIICNENGFWSSAPVCIPRPRFYIGPKGETGDPGIMGPKGEPGDAGQLGPMGLSGQPGRKGPRGPRGPRGAIGIRGSQGFQGTQGTAGANGMNGRNGERGADGDPGAPGAPGPQGGQGEQGFRGQPGDPGPIGAPGNFILWRRSAFCVKLGGGRVISGQPIAFQEVLYNEDGDYNMALRTFVCRINGVYAFHAYFEVNTRSALISLIVNGQVIYRNYQTYSSFAELSTVGTIVKLNVGDKVWVQTEDSENGVCRNSYFMGYLIYECK
ncbi:complement C1q tumor necrosis factor-related protein 2-like [Heterodontus francisci]|uniref:complement C1q tumor necrosis factor-related protein 2-like n=1 Tax=Heterodontus francisci TaxID=7792 RepID=UPI00355BACEC